MRKKKLSDVEPVKFKEHFGMEPGKWLTILYSIAFILIIFLIGILPDLIHSSKMVSFSSDKVNNCAVYINGNYAGGTPFTKKVSDGSYNVEYKINGETIDSFSIDVSKPIFFSWLFPRKQAVVSHASLTEPAFKALTSEFVQDVVNYSAILDYSDEFKYPNLFTEYANNIVNSCFNAEEAMDFAFCFITTKEMLDDALNSCDILNYNRDLSLNDYKKSTPQFLGLSRPYTGSLYIGTTQIKGNGVNGFYASDCPVSEKLYSEFIKNNPEWSKDNIDYLVDNELADWNYLADFSGNKETPVKNISWHAAKAFCEWASAASGHEIFLPTEFQWVSGTGVNGEKSYSQYWEYTDTYYVPCAESNENMAQNYISENGIVCDVIVKHSKDLYAVGTIMQKTCSDFATMRIYWE